MQKILGHDFRRGRSYLFASFMLLIVRIIFRPHPKCGECAMAYG